MIKNLFEAIAISIKDMFDSPLLMIEDIEQNLTPPCFVLQQLGTDYRPHPTGGRRIDIPVDVLYFPADDTAPREECMHTQFKLFQALERVTGKDGTGYRGRSISADYVDGVLHTYATYSMWIREDEDISTMESLSEEMRTD